MQVNPFLVACAKNVLLFVAAKEGPKRTSLQPPKSFQYASSMGTSAMVDPELNLTNLAPSMLLDVHDAHPPPSLSCALPDQGATMPDGRLHTDIHQVWFSPPPFT